MSNKNREHEETSQVPDQIFDNSRMDTESDPQITKTTDEEGPLALSVNKELEPTVHKESEPITQPQAQEGIDEGSQGTEISQPRDETPKDSNQEPITGAQDTTESNQIPKQADELPKTTTEADSDPTTNEAVNNDEPGQTMVSAESTVSGNKLPKPTEEADNDSPTNKEVMNDAQEKLEEYPQLVLPPRDVAVTSKKQKSTNSNVLPKWGRRPGEVDNTADEEDVDSICKSIKETKIRDKPSPGNPENPVIREIRKTGEKDVDTIVKNLEEDEIKEKQAEKLTKKVPSSAPNIRGQTRRQQSDHKKTVNASKPKKQKSASTASTEQTKQKKNPISPQNANRIKANTQTSKRSKDEHKQSSTSTFNIPDTRMPPAANKKTIAPVKIPEIIDLSSDEVKLPDLPVNKRMGNGQETAQKETAQKETGRKIINDPRLQLIPKIQLRRCTEAAKPKPVKEITNPRDKNNETQTDVVHDRRTKNKKGSGALIPINKDNARATIITRKYLKKLEQHQARQEEIAKSGYTKEKETMSGRLNQHMEVIILPNGGAGLVRKSGIKYKPVHGEEYMSEKDIAKKRERAKAGKNYKQRRIPHGQMVKHTRNIKRKYLGKEECKYFRARYFGLRLAKAREMLEKEAVPPVKKSVWIKGKNGKPGYMKEDPRLKRAITAIKHQIRVAIPMDEDVNPELGPFEKRKNITDYPLIQINSEASDEEIEQDPAKEIPLNEVSMITFLARSQLVGNQSGDESEFESDGTPIIVKIEQKSDDSDIEEFGQYNAQDPKPGTSTPTLTVRQIGQEDTDSSEDEEPTSKEEMEASREMVTYRLVRELSANPNIATAMVQALKSIELDIPTDNGEVKRCGVDFMKIEIPKITAKIKKVRKKREKG